MRGGDLCFARDLGFLSIPCRAFVSPFDSQCTPRDLERGFGSTAVKGEPTLLPRCLKVATQAVSVTWVDNGTSDKHLLEPLPSYSIQKLESSIAEIRGVNQPFPSFGGRPGESKIDF